jgi:glycosyltransferase involved in cell wall biosynthesis
MPKLSIVLPSWGRDGLTKTILNAVCMQTFQDFEIFFLGDCCPIFEKIITSEEFIYFKKQLGNKLIYKNFLTHDGTSAQAINYAMQNSTGEFFLFLSNDDNIFPNHFENYYTYLKKSGKDFGIFKTYLDYGNGVLHVRQPIVAFTKVGHSELCVSNNIIKNAPEHSRLYGHDFQFIANIINMGYQYELFNNPPTYIVNMNHTRDHSWGV